MSAGLDLGRDLQSTVVTQPLTSLPSTAGERMGAAWADAQAPDHYWNIQGERRQRAQKIIDDYKGLTGEKLLNPFDNAPTMEEIRANPGVPTVQLYANRLQAMRDKTAKAREGIDPGVMPQGFLDVDGIDASIAQESGAARARNENLTGTGNGFPAFLAASAGGMASPHGVASMFLPVSRLPLAAAEGIAGGFLRNVGKEALIQAAGQTAAQAVGAAIDYGTRKPLGTEQHPAEIAEELLGAAAGGAVFGGVFRGAHLGLRSLVGHGVDIPPAVKDAALVMESADLYGDKNALKIPVAAHEAATDRAVNDIAAGRAAQVADIAQPSPRPSDVVPREPPPAEPPRPFDEALTAKRDEVWADKELMGNTQQGMLRNEDFVTEEARLRLMREEAGAMMEKAKDIFGLTDEDLTAIGRQYRRGEGEQPADAFVRTADAYVTAQERNAIRADGTFDAPDREFLEGDLTSVAGRDPDLQKLFDMVYPTKAEPGVTHDIPFTPPEEGTLGRPTEAASPQDKTMDAQVKQLVEEGGPAPAHLKQAYERVAQEEKEARIAAGCVGGGAL